MSTEINIKKKISILEESVAITTDVKSIDFVGSGVNATTVGNDVTITIPGSSGDTTYYLNQTIAQAPYKEFSSIVTNVVEQVVPLTVAGGVTSVIAEYQTPSGIPGTTQIPGGLWQFFLHFNAAAVGQNWIIRPTVYKRDLGGIETLLFTSDPEIVTGMSTTTTMYVSDGVFPATTLLTTDRIVVRISMQNTTGVSQTVNFRTEGSQHYSVGLTTLNQIIPTGAVTNVTGTAPVVSSGGTTPAISIPQADTLTDGYLSSSDFAVFDAKVQSVTGLNTDNTDPLNPIINISVDGSTITGDGTPLNPLVSVGTISGSGTTNYVSKFTSASALGNSLIQDDGTTVSINNVPQANISLSVLSTKEYGFASENTKTTSNTYGIYGGATGVGKARGVGVYGESSGGTLSNIGTEGAGVGGTVAIGGKFTSSTATTNYSVQLQDGTEGIGKVLTSMTADGKAQWQTPASGTVTSVTGTSPLVSSGGATPAISIPAATTLVNGYLTSTDWTTFDNKGNGTVTSVAALTLGTTGTDLSSTVATGTSTPVITLQVPTASAANRGALSSSDWTIFNAKQATISLTTTGTSGAATLIGTTLNIPQYAAASSTWNVTTQVGASYTAVANDYVLVNAATQTVTLPAAANGIRVGVKMINATVTNIRVLTPSAGVTIDGTDRSVTGMPIFNQYDAYTFVSDGTNWFIIG